MLTGEALPPELCRRWLGAYPAVPLVNAYGPTECSDDVTHDVVAAAPAEAVVRMPIGRPVGNMRLYVLDEAGQPVPVGVPGELYVGGVGRRRGATWADPGATAERFVPDPFAGAGGRLYRTGDLARWRADGALEFLGRLDHQVKLRGFRIELGEVEAALRAAPGGARGGRAGARGRPRRPAAGRPTSSARGGADAGAAERAARLTCAPGCPSTWCPPPSSRWRRMPLTPNGKVDRRALPAPERRRGGRPALGAPATALERVLAALWGEVLGVDRGRRRTTTSSSWAATRCWPPSWSPACATTCRPSSPSATSSRPRPSPAWPS